jgi:hypothetical protein
MTILNAIVIAVGKKNKNKTIQLLKENQKYLTKNGVYYNIQKEEIKIQKNINYKNNR